MTISGSAVRESVSLETLVAKPGLCIYITAVYSKRISNMKQDISVEGAY